MFGRVGRVVRRALAARKLRRRIRAVRHVPVVELVDGALVRVTGMARPGGPVLEAPVSARTCVYYAVVVYEWRGDGSVREVATEQEGIEFALVEGEHRIVIDPRQATVSAAFDRTRTWTPQVTEAHPAVELLRRHGVTAQWDARYECCEAILEVDEAIAAVGTAVAELDPNARPEDGGYRDAVHVTRFRLVGSAAQELVISDDAAARGG